jgi:hypothetical protein
MSRNSVYILEHVGLIFRKVACSRCDYLQRCFKFVALTILGYSFYNVPELVYQNLLHKCGKARRKETTRKTKT